jgi:hypothetical protein
LLTVAILLCSVGCSRPPPDATPEGALREWLDRMQTEPNARAAYGLLGASTRQKLEKRAERSSRIEGHRVEPYEILAQGRFALRFPPKHFKTAMAGDTATIDVSGDEPSDVATLHCVKEGPVWRVNLDLPDLVDLPRRQESP